MQQAESIKNLKLQLQVARSEISNLRQQLKALNCSNKKDYDDIRDRLESFRCRACSTNQLQDEAGSLSNIQKQVTFHYIGIISSDFHGRRGTPRQPGICPNVSGKLTLYNDVFTNPSHALEGLQEYSHMWIIFHFHDNDSTHVRAKVSPPRLNGEKRGVFATRSPHRPCAIGMSLVKIDRIMDDTIYFQGVDMINGTPVLDIKPYIPQYDNPNVKNTVGGSLDIGLERCVGDTNRHQNAQEHNGANSRLMDGEENVNQSRSLVLPEGSNEVYQPSREATSFPIVPDSSRIGEREAPDGEEEEDLSNQTRSSGSKTNEPVEDVRIPTWVTHPPTGALNVIFKERALTELQQLGAEGEEKKTTITNVLREDPRSVYLRQRCGSHCYVFRIAELYVSCKFNQDNHSVTVYKVFQNSATEDGD